MRAIVCILLLFFIGCSKGGDNVVVIYTAHDLIFSEPILKEFEKKTGIKTLIVGDTEAAKTVGLVNKLIALKERPEADVFWNNEIIRTIILKEKGILKKYSPESAKDIPGEYRDSDGMWTGFAARARVILYNTDLVTPEDAPRSIFDLVKPEWKGKVAIANPLFGSTSTHVAALFQVLGEERAKKFFSDLKANEVKVVAGNAMARNLVMEGEIAVCLTDTDDANGAFLKNKPVEMIYPDQDSIGTLVFPNTVMLINGAPNEENGKKLVEYLLSREIEQKLAGSRPAQLPVRSGIEPYSSKFDTRSIKAMDVDWEKVSDTLKQSNDFIKEVFLR